MISQNPHRHRVPAATAALDLAASAVTECGMSPIDLSARARLGRNVRISAEEVEVGQNVEMGDNVLIEVRRLELADHVRIDADVVVLADTLAVGYASRIETRCRLAGMRGPARVIRIGEQSLLGHDTKLAVTAAAIGDYTTVHNHGLLNGRRTLVIGHNVWIGQNCVLNAEDQLTIGNNASFSPYNSVYTHAYSGDLLEGCQVFKIAPVVIEDDVWILGSYSVISPGLTVGHKALILSGTIVTRDIPANRTVAGSPARDLTDRIVPYRDVSPAEKFERIQTFIREFLDTAHPERFATVEDGFRTDAFRILFVRQLTPETVLPAERPLLVFAGASELPANPEGVTVFDLGRRQYTRTRSAAEVEVIRFLFNRARFVPTDQPRVNAPV
jgi:acetyltransferase-like isoleucine patch superfamily enzyme